MIAVPPVLQVIAALVLVGVIAFLTLMQFQKEQVEAVRTSSNTRREVVIFSGIKDYASDKMEVYDAMNPKSMIYKAFPNSVNQDGGSEYSYNFWMYFDQTALAGTTTKLFDVPSVATTLKPDDGLVTVTRTNRNLAPLVLFMRGDPTVVTYNRVCQTGATATLPKEDVIVKNPIVKLENGGDVLSVEFNTADVPDAHQECPKSNGEWTTTNAHKVGVQGILGKSALNQKWFMVTIVVQETNPELALSMRNKTTCKIYINGKIQASQSVQGGSISVGKYADSPVRTPTGNFYFNYPLVKDTAKKSLVLNDAAAMGDTAPGSSGGYNNKLMMSDLSFFNYAVPEAQVTSLYKRGFTKSAATPYTAITSTFNSSGFSGTPTNTIPIELSTPLMSIGGK